MQNFLRVLTLILCKDRMVTAVLGAIDEDFGNWLLMLNVRNKLDDDAAM